MVLVTRLLCVYAETGAAYRLLTVLAPVSDNTVAACITAGSVTRRHDDVIEAGARRRQCLSCRLLGDFSRCCCYGFALCASSVTRTVVAGCCTVLA